VKAGIVERPVLVAKYLGNLEISFDMRRNRFGSIPEE
jgi:hypothetical protein